MSSRLGRLVAAITFVLVAASGLIPSASVPSVYACYNWSVGARVGLKRGGEIRRGSGTQHAVHTIVPEDNWLVDIAGGPRSADGQQWWDISRKNIDGGGTGWVSLQQAGFDVCGSSSPPAPQPQPQPQPQPPAPIPAVNNVQLCEHDNYNGRCESFTGSDPNLSDNPIGNDTVTSIHVPPGRTVALYEHDNYKGKCATFTSDNPNIGNTPVGNDNVTSIQLDVACSSSPPPATSSNPNKWLVGWQPYEQGRAVYWLTSLGKVKNCKQEKGHENDEDYKFKFNMSSTEKVDKLRIFSSYKDIRNVFERKPPEQQNVVAVDLNTSDPAICIGQRDVSAIGGAIWPFGQSKGVDRIQKQLFVWVDD